MNEDQWILRALELANLAPPCEKAFAVGAVLVNSEGKEIASGFSRQFGENIHAEEALLNSVRGGKTLLKGCTLYSTLEPCFPRLSGRRSCSELIVEAGISTVVFALREPEIFVKCRGEQYLLEHGIVVRQNTSCLEQAQRLLQEKLIK